MLNPLTPATLAFLGPIGWQEMLLLAVLGILIFGKRLPEVGKSIGRGIVEFKKGLAGIDDEIDAAVKKDQDAHRIENTQPQQPVDLASQHQQPAESETNPPEPPPSATAKT